jgi:hypothetical protein
MEELRRRNLDVIIALIVGRLQELEHLNVGFGFLHRVVLLLAILRHLNFNRGGQHLYNGLHRVAMGLDALQSSGC